MLRVRAARQRPRAPVRGRSDDRRVGSLQGLRPAAAVIVILLGLAIAACGGSSRARTSRQTDYSTLIGAGVQLLRMNNLPAATQLFQQAIVANPNDPVGYYDLGVAYQQQGLTRRAIRQYSRALRVNGQYVPALYNKAVLVAKRDIPTAIFLYRQVIAIKPDSPTALLNLGLLLAAQKGLERQAYHALVAAIRLDPALRRDLPAGLLARLSKPPRHESTRGPASPPS